jgi:hypothetical protein
LQLIGFAAERSLPVLYAKPNCGIRAEFAAQSWLDGARMVFMNFDDQRHRPRPIERHRVSATTTNGVSIMRTTKLVFASITAVLGISTLSGCMLFRAADDIRAIAQGARIVGSTETPDSSNHPVIVGLVRDTDGEKTFVAYNFQRGRGTFEFLQKPGRYYIFAFEDSNENLKYDEGEPAYYVGAQQAPLDVAAGQRLNVGGIRLVKEIPKGVAELRAVVKRDLALTPELARPHRGTLVTWNDPRFALQVGPAGMWTPLETYKEYGAGVFFFEPYDPARLPVVFVHGNSGTAYDFKTIIEKLDRTRFQPWVFQYPSGFRLELISDFLVRTLDELQALYKFDRYAIVAHSMGGLVSRAAVNKIVKRDETPPIMLFVTISTPWEGHEAAKTGAQYSPVVLPVWLDMVPGSPYLSHLLETQLPATVPYYLIYGYEGGAGTDGTVSLRSVLKLEAQDQSVRTTGFPDDHKGILQSGEVIDRLNALLTRHAVPRKATSMSR